MSGSVHDNLTAYTTALSHAMHKLDQLKVIIRDGLNAGNGDGEWAALVDAGGELGLQYNEEEGRYE